MLKTVAFRVLAALLITTMVGISHATAGLPGEVAHSAMGGSTLMRTSAQFNAWTHWLVDYDNFVELNVSENPSPSPWKTSSMAGQASLHWKYDDSNHLFFRVRQDDLGAGNINYLLGSTLEHTFLSPVGIIDGILRDEIEEIDDWNERTDINAYRDGQMVNLAWARPLGGGGAFSLGLFYASRGVKEESEFLRTGEDEDWFPVTNSEELDAKSNAFGGQVSWGNGEGLDVSVGFAKANTLYDAHDQGQSWVWDVDEDEYVQRNFEDRNEGEIDLTHFTLAARYEIGGGWIGQLGGVMGSGTRTESTYDYYQGRTPDEIITTAKPDVDYSIMGVTANIGRVLLDSDSAGVTTEFFINYFRSKKEWKITETWEEWDPEEEEVVDMQTVVDHLDSTSDLTIPGTRVACWTRISKRFQIMAGATAYWGKTADKDEWSLASYPAQWGQGSEDEESTDSEYQMFFGYSGGLAYVPSDGVRIEGQLDMGMLNNLLTLGNRDPLLLRVGATFTF